MITDLDQKILDILTENARRPVSSIADALGVARTTVQSRIERLENSGVIRSYTLRLGEDYARKELVATILFQIDPAMHNRVLQKLGKIKEVESAINTSGRFDILVKVRCRNAVALDQIYDQLDELEGIQSTETMIHLRTRIDRGVRKPI